MWMQPSTCKNQASMELYQINKCYNQNNKIKGEVEQGTVLFDISQNLWARVWSEDG